MLLTLAAPAFAQEGNIRRLTFYTVQGGKGGDFRAAIKEYNEVLKKAGSDRSYSIWQAMSGPREYVRVDYYKTWAEFDRGQDPKLEKDAGTLSGIVARINSSTESARTVIDEVIPSQSLPRTADFPKMVQVLRTVIQPGKRTEYDAVIESDLMPAIRKSGMKFYVRSRTRFGGPSTEVRSVVALSSYADLDGTSPVVKAMGGQAAYDKFVAKIRPFMVESEYNIYRHVPELSYTAPTSTSSAR
jgi:hypothetical protein